MRCDVCGWSVQLAFAVVDLKPRQCEKTAFVQAALTRCQNQASIQQFFSRFEELITRLPPSLFHHAQGCTEITVVITPVLGCDVDQ